MKRDPRIDPAPGDILRWAERRERHVTDIRDGWYASGFDKCVNYREVRKNGNVGGFSCSLAAWRKWAARDSTKVIQTGGEG